MRKPGTQEKVAKQFGPLIRKAVQLSDERFVNVSLLETERTLPVVMYPGVEGVNLVAWASSHRDFIENRLLKHGAVLFRDFSLKSVADFEQFIVTLSGELLEYRYRSTPRSQVSGKIYTSTEYPSDQSIPLHNELAYSHEWPMKILFLCMRPAKERGETPIADSRAVFNRIDPKIREQFMQKKVMYVRNYGHELDLPWQNVFQTESKSEVEDYCREAGIEVEWMDKDHLRTRQVCHAAAKHPKTGEMVWFNQAHLFHVSNLKPEIRESLLSMFEEKYFPRNAYYGNGAPIEISVLDEIREIYQQEAMIFPWREGDMLMLDNMLTAHGRAPFVGPRKVLVGMAEPFASRQS